jgi:peptide-methionine (R)-S-oxide reductase
MLIGGGLAAGTLALLSKSRAAEPARGKRFEVQKTDAEWKAMLSPAAYDVLRHEGTERAGTSPLLNEHREGNFLCAGCALPLFSSKTKFESGTGWPSFYAPLPNAVETTEDKSFLMVRTEVHCRRCGGHLGHVFDDGPKPTGLRYCMNGVALTFRPGAA